MPQLAASGRWILSGAVGLTASGLLSGVAPVALAGSALLTGLALAYVSSLPLSRTMRRSRLEFSWWLAPRVEGAAGAGPRRPDEAVGVRVLLRNPTDETLVFSTPRLALSPGVRYTRWQGQRIEVPPRSAVTFDLEVRPAHVGRHVLHGAWMSMAGPLGVVWIPLYFPSPLVIEVQPRGAGALGMMRSRAGPQPTAVRAGRATRRAGEGPELRELRDHQPGDPYRRIAWGPSARRGKLLVRETEDETQTSRVMIVDASATMRGDDRGRARLDYAIELCAQAARFSLGTGDRLGLVGFDARVVCTVPPGDGAAHLRSVSQAAVELRSLVDDDLTDVDDEQLVETVARYFREQEGVDVFRGVLAYEARSRIVRLIERSASNDPAMRLPVRASEHTARVMRSFCRARAIPLPLKHDPHGAAKTAGLAEALRAAVDGAREARTLLVVSDLDAMGGDWTALRLAVGYARQKRHRLTFVAPAGEDFLGAMPTDLTGEARATHEAVGALLLADEQTRLDAMRKVLGAMGAVLYMARSRDTFTRWLQRAAAPRR